jgi:hypothetical protein
MYIKDAIKMSDDPHSKNDPKKGELKWSLLVAI